MAKKCQKKLRGTDAPVELTVHCIEGLLNELNRQALSEPEIVLDGANVQHIDACGLQLLLAGAKEAQQKGKTFVMTNPSEYLKYIFKITGASKIIPFRKELQR